MAYTVLARRYRSQTFDDVVGQAPAAQTLKNAVQSGRVAHAYLFTGTRGVGKTTMARILAKALNCLKSDAPTIKPCLKCDSCVAINAGEDIDVIEIDGASNRGIDDIRELRQNAIYRPARARYKIYIIDEVHMLTTDAFNALLKILEEPPEHVKFIFATTEPNKVLATIQSRCQRFDFFAIAPDVIAGQLKSILKSEKIKFDDDLVIHLARLANGSMRDALSLLDQLISTGSAKLTVDLLQSCLGLPDRDKISLLVKAIGSGDAAAVLEQADQLLKSGLSAVQLTDALTDLMRDIMVAGCTDENTPLLVLTADERNSLAELTALFDVPALIYDITAMERLRWSIKNSDNPRALLEALLLRLAMSEHFIGLNTLAARLESGSAPPKDIKKKTLRSDKPPAAAPLAEPTQNSDADAQQEQSQELPLFADSPDLAALKSAWPAVLSAFRAIDAGTAVYLGMGIPSSCGSGRLVISFPKTAELARSMCLKRQSQLEKNLGDILGAQLSVGLESGEQPEGAKPVKPAGARITQKEKEQALNDRAVQTLFKGLDAKLINIQKGTQP